MRNLKFIKHNSAGFTLVELLLSLFLTGVIGVFALRFYAAEHNNLIIQQNVSDMQQNLRASLREVSRRMMNAGASIPGPVLPLECSNTNPDTLTIRYAPIGGNIAVGDHTQKRFSSPIHVDALTDLSMFEAGQSVFLWFDGEQQGEWFTVTKIALNSGGGWVEVHHQGQDLLFDPEPGDRVIAMEQFKYYIDNSDTAHPLFMSQFNEDAAAIYADNISDFQIEFILRSGDTVQTLKLTDTVAAGRISIAAHTDQLDYDAMELGNDGRRHRILSTDVTLRNSRQ